jgi:hypothetical protein
VPGLPEKALRRVDAAQYRPQGDASSPCDFFDPATANEVRLLHVTILLGQNEQGRLKSASLFGRGQCVSHPIRLKWFRRSRRFERFGAAATPLGAGFVHPMAWIQV